MDGKKLVLVGVVFLMLAIPVEAELTYDETTESDCWFDENNLKHCWKALYSGFSPTFFKEVISKESNWLKFYDVVYLERDEKSDIIIKSFNATDIEFQLRSVESEMSKSIPFYACKDDPSSKESVCYQMNYVLNAISRDYHLGINLLEYRFLKFGLGSTTIMLQDADSENLEDAWIDEYSPTTKHGSDRNFELMAGSGATYKREEALIKFNISSIPSEKIIDSAMLYFYMNSEGVDNGESFHLDAHHDYNQTWLDHLLIWNTATTHSYNTTYESRWTIVDDTGPLLNKWHNWTVTNMVSKAYSDSDTNLTIWIRSVYVSGNPSYNDDLDFRTKEETNTSLRPYLNITYSEGAPPTNDYNFTLDLSLSWSDPTNRTLDAVRENDLIITYSDSNSRILSANRLATLTLSWSDNIYATALKIYSRLISLALGWSDNTYRTLDANREVDQTITFTDSGTRTLTANRLAELSIGWSDETYVKALKIFNRLVSLALGWSDETYRTLDANREVYQTITFTDIGSRILNANRLAELSLGWSDNTYSSLTHFFNRLITLALTWNDPTNRTLDAERGAMQTITFTGNAERTADMIRQGSLPINWNDNSYRTLDAVREIDLILTWLDNVIVVPPGAQDFVRIITLLLNLDFDQTTYIRSWESVDPYEFCSVLKQIGESRAYLCIYPDGDYKILIKGV